MSALGLLLIRLVFGLTFAAHGTQKLFGWFGGPGLAGTAGWLESIGIKPGKLQATVASVSEIIAGLLLAAGLWLPIAAILVTIIMLVAIATVHGKNGYWVSGGGFEYNIAILVVAIGLALTGPGAYTLVSLFQ